MNGNRSVSDIEAEIEIQETVTGQLRKWPEFKDEHIVSVHRFGDDKTWIGYRSALRVIPGGYTTYFDANMINGVFYLMHVELENHLRYRGLGDKLYTVLEQIATALGCGQIHQTPSGWTPRGETRMEYLIRRGWQREGQSVWVYKVLPLQP